MIVDIQDKKRLIVNDEIKFVNYMSGILEKGFTGESEKMVLGEEPIRRFYSGVLFSAEQFVREIYSEEDSEPDTKYRGISKNYNVGLEFLAEPVAGKIKGKITGSFNLYPRSYPTYKEQMQALEYLVEKEEESANNNEEFTERKSKGITLLEKYEQLKVEFNDLEFEINSNKLEQSTIPLKDLIVNNLINMFERDDFFNVSSNFIDRTGAVKLKVPNNRNEYMEYLEDIKNEEKCVPNWDASIVIDPILYKGKNGERLVKIVVTVVNESPLEDDEYKTGHPTQLFNAGFSLTITEGEHIPFYFDGAVDNYKYDKRYHVKGINCSGDYEVQNNRVVLKTEVVPKYFQKHYRTREDLTVDFDDLSNPESVFMTLNDVELKMRRYLQQWKDFIDNGGDSVHPLKNENEVKKCKEEMDEFRKEINSFELGIYSLKKDSNLMKSFIMMNKVFKNSGEGKYTSWRLFQIVFIVRMIPSLYFREMPETELRAVEIQESSGFADVLWFPTGGGKTEAYLGIIVTVLFYDRLRGKKRGCSAWLRFPLRMLSKNQLDRLAKVMIYAEEFRQNTNEIKDKGKPFSIGFFAGSGNTDNFVSQKSVTKAFANEISIKNKMLIHKCPKCKSNLSFSFDKESWRYIHRCDNQECFVNQNTGLNGVIPLYITDSEVYRFIPSIICGTVDKLAILGRYREFSHLFGQIGGVCEKHGFFSDRCVVGAYDEYDSCNEKVKNTASYKKKVEQIKESIYDPIPSLLIQDELHLLKEELGALDGHYEGVILEYGRKFGRKNNHFSKVIAATATIESYEHHIKHLYMREPRRYPSMGFNNGESFYATSNPQVDRRLYIGVLPHTKSQEEVMGRAVFLYQKEIQRLIKDKEKALVELGFASIDNTSDLMKFLANYDLSTIYVNTKTTGFEIRNRISEMKDLNHNLSSALLTGENDMDVIIKVIDKIESEGGNTDYKDKLQVLIATSLISHGVDLERINSFFMAGMPSKQAEYIQASSRSARSHAGLVFVSFRPTDLRERSQYQFFIQNHTFMDSLVDPVPINRLALKAIERTLPGVLSGLLLGFHSQFNDLTIYNCGIFQDYKANMGAKGDSLSELIIEQLNNIYGVNNKQFPLSTRQKVEKFVRKLYLEKEFMLDTSSKTLKIKSEECLNPITSFRDIEEGIPLQATLDTALILRYSSGVSVDNGGK